MTPLADHRRFARATVAAVAGAAILVAVALLAGGRRPAALGVVAGATIAEVDAVLLARSLTRLGDHLGEVGARTLTTVLMVRFLVVSSMVGTLLCARGLDPLGVVVGILLLPVAIVAVALLGQRRERTAGSGRPVGVAR